MTVTHLDGFPIEPVEVDAVSLAIGERIDVLLAPAAGVWPLLAATEGKTGSALTWIRSSGSVAEARQDEVGGWLPEHGMRLFDLASARAAETVALPFRKPDQTVDVALTGGMSSYDWGIDGRQFGKHHPLEVSQGERLRLRFRNRTRMVHPMHLHGHTFALAKERGPRKDTILVDAMDSVTIDVQADNPGRWMLHCHNTYHLKSGMATELSYMQ